MADETPIDMKVAYLTVDPLTNLPVVILQDASGRESLPIGIGVAEAHAIVAELERIQLERPLAHELLSQVMAKVGVRIDRIELRRAGAGFRATLHLVLPGGVAFAQEARASDALAVALRNGAAIRVPRRALWRSSRGGLRLASGTGRLERPRLPPPRAADHGAAADVLGGLSDEAFGKWKM